MIGTERELPLRAKKIVKNLKVTKDSAERGVKLMTDFNSILTRDEEQRQYLLHVVAENRKLYPKASKDTLGALSQVEYFSLYALLLNKDLLYITRRLLYIT